MASRQPSDEAIFEQLLLLRRLYPLRGDYDSRAVLGIAAAVDYGEWRMRLARVSEVRHRGWRTGSAA